jgi:hypothetical protein
LCLQFCTMQNSDSLYWQSKEWALSFVSRWAKQLLKIYSW